MGLEAKLVQKLSQSLLMTPQLQQAIKLLQLGRLEFKEAIDKELLENPILEEVKEEVTAPNQNFDSDSSKAQSADGEAAEGEQIKADPAANPQWEEYLDHFNDYRGAAAPKGAADFDDRPSAEATLTKAETLHDHIIAQVRLAEIDDHDKKIILHVIGNLDKDGYLCSTYEEIAEACQCDVADVQRVMIFFRSLDPPGVGSRSLGECLLLQLENLGLGEGLAARIVHSHLERLERRKYDQIAKMEEVALEEVYKAVTAIKSLEPRPGRSFGEDATRYIIPDIYVYKVGSEYVISLNEDGLPKLRVSPYYLDLLKNAEGDQSTSRAYLNERLKAASWLIKSIHQRQHTIYRETESIVKFQREFFDHGIHKLKPLVLKDVAVDIGMHESTVSRVTSNKYVHTPQGVFELKYFFTTGIKSSEGDVSSSSVKEKIKNLVAEEPQDSPISDQQIVDILKKENINIARRTVAKYRDALGIESSSRRKKLF